MAGVSPLAWDADLVYDMDYFTGCQVATYVGDVWIDEIVNIQLEVTQAKTPIYGYASELWDALARGPKLVRGAFTINFKEAGYLFAVLKHYQESIRGKAGILTPYKGSNKIMRANIERIMSLPANDPALYKAYADLAGFASEAQKQWIEKAGTKEALTYGAGVDPAESVFEVFEDAIWKQNGIASFNKQFKVNSRSSLAGELNGFDIYIQFGDFTNDLANHTIIKLETVELVGQSMVINADDEPILEAYNFIARNWV